MGVLDVLKKKEIQKPDEFPLPRDHPRVAEHLLISAYLQEVLPLVLDETPGGIYASDVKPADYITGRTILELEAAQQAQIAVALTERRQRLNREIWAKSSRNHAVRNPIFYEANTILSQISTHLLRRKLIFQHDDIVDMLQYLQDDPFFSHSIRPFLIHIERYAQDHGVGEEIKALLRKKREDSSPADTRRIDKLTKATFTLQPVFPWARVALDDLETMNSAQRSAWARLLEHAASAESSRPTQKWLKAAQPLLDEVGAQEFQEYFRAWLAAVANTDAPVLDWDLSDYEQYQRWCETSNAAETVLRGLVWYASLIPISTPEESSNLAGVLGQAVRDCYQTRDFAPTASKAGHACIWALSQMEGEAPIVELSRLRAKIKHRGAQKTIQKALDEAAQKSGVTAAELEENAVPTYEMTEPGVLCHAFSEYSAQIIFDGSAKPQWQWAKADGKTQKSTPSVVQSEYSLELKQLKNKVNEIKKTLSAQRERIDRIFLENREWEYSRWEKYYHNHPLVGIWSRRLIWHFGEGDSARGGIWHNGRFVDASDEPLPKMDAKTTVRLWHPIGVLPERVLRWRAWLQKHEVTQPFKQAHREVYILTDAEMETRTYSNRFAGHILKQGQFKALSAGRGWQYAIQGGWDGGGESVAQVGLPAWNLRAEFWVEPVWDAGINDMGFMLYVATDQVRFYRADETEALPLCEVPAMPFSEVMRTVDLFVGVASIGNDPNWQDRGEDARFGDYWHDFSFGDLSASAKTRAQILETLLPRLKIAEHCELDGRFLRVRGDLRTYKIHLGSTNILMEPNDQYLCIVPGRGTADKNSGHLFLPFEGDTSLSVILSKAFLLADDKSITDSSIVSQIQRN